MQLIVLYGAPGVGKLTVAQELAKLTGYKVLHNHLTVDLVTAIFPFGSDQQTRLTTEFRLTMIHEAALAGVPGVIFTMVYGAGNDDAHFKDIIDTVESAGGTVAPVLLVCAIDTLRKRLGEESRAKFGKIRDVKILDSLMSEEDFDIPYPDAKGLMIDTTVRSPGEVALQIREYLEGRQSR